jgi:Zn finger protein HypA/HybF involved in hydrogenase expression
MSKRHPNHRLVKIHRTYTVEDVANLFGIHKNTVRTWLKTGLATIDDKRPMLIHGKVLASFLLAKRAKHKQPCQPGEIYCVKCRAPKPPAGDMTEYQPVTATVGNLMAICPSCESIMNRRISLAKLALFSRQMDITLPQALQHIVESNQPTVNSDLRKGE